jgi:hypothetical protein
MRMKFVHGDNENRRKSRRGGKKVREREMGQPNRTKREIEVPGRGEGGEEREVGKIGARRKR